MLQVELLDLLVILYEGLLATFERLEVLVVLAFFDCECNEVISFLVASLGECYRCEQGESK